MFNDVVPPYDTETSNHCLHLMNIWVFPVTSQARAKAGESFFSGPQTDLASGQLALLIRKTDVF